MAAVNSAFSSAVSSTERPAADADRKTLQFAAILDLLDELAALEDVHRTVENLHLLAGLGEVARAWIVRSRSTQALAMQFAGPQIQASHPRT